MKLKKSIVILTLIVVFSPVAFSSIQSLIGLEGVYVGTTYLGEPLDFTKEQLEQQLQTDIELKLRQSGIKVLSKGDVIPLGRPFLFLFVDMNKIKEYHKPTWSQSKLAAGTIRLYLQQDVILCRDKKKSVMIATTYQNYCLLTSRIDHTNAIREMAKMMMDVFCKDYLSANPKKQMGKDE